MSKADRQVCQLVHPGFRMLGEPVFRLSEGMRVASMVVQLDNHDAVLPLRSIAREFGINAETADGEMLGLIEEALEFVVALRIGDMLPSELHGGEASWTPGAQDRAIAMSRIRRELVRCVFARRGEAVQIQGSSAPGWEEEGTNRALLRKAIDGAVAEFPGTDAPEITLRVDTIGEELSYIENLRRTLARGMAGPQEKLLRVRTEQVPAGRRDLLHQVQKLARRGLKEISNRFDGVDVRLDDMLAVLSDTPASVVWLRRQRDWLFRTNHAWESIFTEWASVSGHVDGFLWKAVDRTYAFLAPRFMSYQEWLSHDHKPNQQGLRGTVW